MVMLPIKHLLLPLKTNQENLGGAERRGDTSVHSKPCKTNLEEFWKDHRRSRHQPIPPVDLPETLMLKSALTEKCAHCQKGP